jgi:hypothetical protein
LSHQPFSVVGIFKIASYDVFTPAGFKL